MTVQYDDDFMSQRNFINEWKDSNEGGWVFKMQFMCTQQL